MSNWHLNFFFDSSSDLMWEVTITVPYLEMKLITIYLMLNFFHNLSTQAPYYASIRHMITNAIISHKCGGSYNYVCVCDNYVFR